MTKKIGLPIWKLGDNSVGSTLSYILFAEQFGEVILLMPHHEVRQDLDLLILPGGADLDPATYNAYPSMFTQKPDIHKEYFDRVMLPKYISNRTPIFGICRGFQRIWAHFNGKLIQHMSHETNKPEDPYKCVHKITIDPVEFPNYGLFTPTLTLDVNSRHHQAIPSRQVLPAISVIARHSKDETPEVIAHKTLAISAVQFHPEDIYDDATNDFVFSICSHLINERTSILTM